MSSSFWAVIGAIAIVSILVRGIVEIVKVSRGPGGKVGNKVGDLESDVGDLEQEVGELRHRIEVLETIVTDGKYNLGKQIDDLASGQ